MTTTTDNTVDPEDAVRLYLVYLDDPDKLRDPAEIERKEQAVREATDPIERLRAVAERDRAVNVDEAPLRAGFVQHAKAWADRQSIPLSAFRELQVPDDVLREAGFDVPTSRRRGRRNAAAGDGRQRAKAVPVEDIKVHVLNLQGTFLLTDVMNTIGGSPATIRKAVDELVETGQVEKLGPVPDHHGRGRAPVQYSRS